MQCISEQICDLPIGDIYHVQHWGLFWRLMCPSLLGPRTAGELLPYHTVQMNCMLSKLVGESDRKMAIFQDL